MAYIVRSSLPGWPEVLDFQAVKELENRVWLPRASRLASMVQRGLNERKVSCRSKLSLPTHQKKVSVIFIDIKEMFHYASSTHSERVWVASDVSALPWAPLRWHEFFQQERTENDVFS